MPYDNPTVKEFEDYLQALEPEKRQRAWAWGTAIGLQDVDHLHASSFLVKVAIRHINGEITTDQARMIVDEHYEKAGKVEWTRGDSGYEYFDPVTGEKIESLDVFEANRRILKAVSGGKKKTGCLRRVGPDKGGHWEVVK